MLGFTAALRSAAWMWRQLECTPTAWMHDLHMTSMQGSLLMCAFSVSALRVPRAVTRLTVYRAPQHNVLHDISKNQTNPTDRFHEIHHLRSQKMFKKMKILTKKWSFPIWSRINPVMFWDILGFTLSSDIREFRRISWECPTQRSSDFLGVLYPRIS